FHVTSRVHPERTNEYSLAVKLLPSPIRSRILEAKNRLAPRQKDSHKRRGRSKFAHALLDALAVEEWEASRAWQRWRRFRAHRRFAVREKETGDHTSVHRQKTHGFRKTF